MASYWTTQSPVSDQGTSPVTTTAIAALPSSLPSLRFATTNAIYHFTNLEHGPSPNPDIPPSRKAEKSLRYASSILTTLLSRGGSPSLSIPRSPADRVVGCSRDTALLFLTLARSKGIPARGRVCFVSDKDPTEPVWLDHVIVEVYDAEQKRWKMVETMAKDGTEEGGEDYLDLRQGVDIMTAPAAWKAAREGTVNPLRFGVAPGEGMPDFLKGWHYLAHNVLHDLAWLGKKEMLLWDHWGVQGGTRGMTGEEVTGREGVTGDEVEGLLASEGLGVTKMVGTVAPDRGMVEEDVSRVLGL
ncbi:Transglutaminase-like protein [Podospora aff. communis PSN243]|uniref:Transglutaminase-like protein n=1 Tax=Podospora aff. communis PSN243 TaxID=3040156 RepID=A0AAV9G5Q6_9PEZI|nr:Transglutaminase-like protein [Podospora aff. communis PSN243]